MNLLQRSKFNDKALTSLAMKALGEDPTVDDSTITVSVRDGRVTLAGHVHNDWQRRHAIEVVRRRFERQGQRFAELQDQLLIG